MLGIAIALIGIGAWIGKQAGGDNRGTVVGDGSRYSAGSDLRSLTQGKAEFTMEFAKYAPVPAEVSEKLIKEFGERKS